MQFTFSHRVAACVAALMLQACTTVPDDHGREDVIALVAERGLDTTTNADIDTLIGSLLAKPLSAADAVRIALLRNPQVTATYAELGFAAADVYTAGRLSNPELSAASLSAGGVSMLTLGLSQSFTDLLTLNARGRIAEAGLEAAKREVAARIFSLALDVEAAYLDLAEAHELERLREQIAEVADVSAELAQRFHAAGNISRLELSIAQAAASEARLELAGARLATAETRVALATLLGLDHQEWRIAPGLPQMPHHDEPLVELVELAFASRLDLQAARQDAERLADKLGLVRRFRWLGEIRVGVEREREDGERFTGPTLSIELPVFNQQQDELTRAEAALLAAEAALAQRHLGVGHEVELSWKKMRAARQRAQEHREHLLPLRAAIVEETHKRVNFMLADVFDALQAKEREYRAQERALMAEHDYWRFRIELRRATGTALPFDAHIKPAEKEHVHSRDVEDHGHHGAHGTTDTSAEHQHHQPAQHETQTDNAQEEHHHDHAS